MPTIGSGRISPTGTLTFPAQGDPQGLSGFALTTPTQGTNLFESLTQTGNNVTLALRSIAAGPGIQLQVSQGIIYVSLGDVAGVQGQPGPPGPVGPPGPSGAGDMTLDELLSLLSTAPLLTSVGSTALSLVEDGANIGWAQVGLVGPPQAQDTFLLEDASGSLLMEDHSGFLIQESQDG